MTTAAAMRPDNAPASGRPPVGLTEEQATRLLEADGRNEIALGARVSVLRAIRTELTDTVIVVLVAAASLTAAVGDMTDTAVIAAVVVLNTVLGVSQEVRSGRALAALSRLTAPRATVVRDGRAREVDTAEVVRSDVIKLTAGDIVPADATIATAESLRLDESMLTGESLNVSRGPQDAVYAGTVVTGGRAEAVVTATAAATAVGGIAHSLGETSAVQTPVQRQLKVLGRRLALAVAAAAVLVAVLNLAGGRGLETSVVLGISLAVAAIPESLPAVVSMALSLAARRMSALGVLTRRLPAVEALGSVTVIAADKTGTLTEGRMSVERVWTPSDEPAARQWLLTAGVLCSDACSDGGSAARTDDPIEVAIVEAAFRNGIDVLAVRILHPRVAEQPFDAASARMTTTHRTPGGEQVEICKGSPEALLTGLAGPDAEAAVKAAEDLAAAGYRVLAVITRGGDGPHAVTGLLGFVDPPRAAAADVVRAFRAAGIQPIMITGDHPSTAHAVAAALGIEDATERQTVYARVRPDEKRSIIAALQQAGEVVAMTGDGVNDAPALHAADIGVSMGERATEVARQAADLVLTGDDLGAMIPAIREGRRAYDNLRRFLHYALSGGVAEVLVMLLGPIAGFAVPLQAGQILWVNLLTHGLPGVAIGNEPAAADVLRRPPRPPHQQLLDGRTARRVTVLAAVIGAACLAAAAYARHADRPWQSTLFVTLTFAQLAVALCLRPRGTALRANLFLPAAVFLNVLLIVLAVTWTPLRELLHTDPLSARDFLTCAVAAVLPACAARAQALREPRRA